MSDLPKDYDVIIVGTGLTESILSAALSRIGKIVLHLDRSQFYGGEFSSFSLNSLIDWRNNILIPGTECYVDKSNQEIKSIKCNNNLSTYFFDPEIVWNSEEEQNIKETLLEKSRKFNLDLSPNIFYSRGLLIELLIQSDVSKYCEFKMVSQILTLRNSLMEKVPTSRSEVFKSTKLSMIEKRFMMQFVQSCLKENNFEDLIDSNKSKSMSFREFILSKKLPESVQDYLVNAVSMCPDENQSAYEGLTETKKFLTSVGRFGDSPFLYSLYGSGELTQCFCRMSAVFGGLYYLNLKIENFNINSQNVIESIDTKSGQEEFRFNCKHLVLDSSYAPLQYFKQDYSNKKISRCILITDKSIYNKPDNEIDHISLLFVPKLRENLSNINLIEVSYSSQCCPQDYYIVYMFCENNGSIPRSDFEDLIQVLFRSEPIEEKPKILFSFFYSHLDSDYLINNSLRDDLDKPQNLHLVSGAKCKIDYDHNVIEAKKIFNIICPGEEFMPKPPEPEDIIFDDSKPAQESSTS